jgi:cytoskeletal protein CcmA (bactofilin family)
MAEKDDLGIPMRPARSTAATSMPPRTANPARAVPEASKTADPASITPRAEPTERRTMIVGREISVSGDIKSCNRLVVEGSVEATLHDCREIEIAETGLFKGNASIEQAEVRGRFEGELVVTKRLLVRVTGHVSGTITYDEIEIERGGKISGVIQEAGSIPYVEVLRAGQ